MSGRVLAVRRIGREEIEAALWADAVRRRAEKGSLMALAAVTGIEPAYLYALGEAGWPAEVAAEPGGGA